ncbi:MAG: D-sedoheptulose 7-phosphate isomerase [Acidobacteriota bacterium]|nr:D-sedoheptulose 7-phosphate isomerase [Acidobacteriota bacterium]
MIYFAPTARNRNDLSDQEPFKSAFNLRDESHPGAAEHFNSIVATEHINATVSDSIEVKRRYFDAHAADVVRAASVVADCFGVGGKLLVCGNGGSAADAQHIAGEFVNQFLLKDRRALPALALTTDGGVLTCVANDTGFERVFARQVEAFGARGDVLLAITTSGNSPNVAAAAQAAHERGVKVIGLLGRDGGRIRALCDLALVVESNDTQRIQETHNLIGHVLCDLVERILFSESDK